MPKSTMRPRLSALSEKESRQLLRRNHVGRLCFINNGQPDSLIGRMAENNAKVSRRAPVKRAARKRARRSGKGV
jgi:hypothetical protein